MNASMRGTRIYNIWCGMKARCDNPGATVYKYYGGRGIKYCEEWKTFQGFYKDMAFGYADNLTLDRIDSNGNYEPGNCKWSTTAEQSINKRTSRYLSLDGVTKTLSEWARDNGLKSSTICQRMYVYGWGLDRALTQSVNKKERIIF